MDEMFEQLFGINNMTDEERETEEKRLLGLVDVDHVIKDGKVYFSSDRLTEVFNQFSKIMAIRAILANDSQALIVGQGVSLASEVIGQLRSEMLKREAEKSL